MIPSCDHMGVPLHFHSSTTSGSASLMSLRILLKVSPRQSPSSAILLSIRSDADWPALESDSFMFSSRTTDLVKDGAALRFQLPGPLARIPGSAVAAADQRLLARSGRFERPTF